MDLTPIFQSEIGVSADQDKAAREFIAAKMRGNEQLSNAISMLLVTREATQLITEIILCELLGTEKAQNLNETQIASYIQNFVRFMCSPQNYQSRNNPFQETVAPPINVLGTTRFTSGQLWRQKPTRINESEVKHKIISAAVSTAISDGNFCVVNPKTFQDCLNDTFFHEKRSSDDVDKFAESVNFYSHFFSQRTRRC